MIFFVRVFRDVVEREGLPCAHDRKIHRFVMIEICMNHPVDPVF